MTELFSRSMGIIGLSPSKNYENYATQTVPLPYGDLPILLDSPQSNVDYQWDTMAQAKTIFEPEIPNDVAPELQYFDDNYYVRERPAMSDGTMYFDDSNAFALIGNDVTHIGESDDTAHIYIEPTDVAYDRVERPGPKHNADKVWVFDTEEGDVAVNWKYIEYVRDIYGLSLDDIRQKAHSAGRIENTNDPVPILIDISDVDFRPLIMPYRLFD